MEIKSVNTAEAKPRRRKLAQPRNQLDRSDWIELAIDTLAKEGIGGLRIELLAKNRGITKGSFYWHFRDRRDLLLAVLERWKEGRIQDIEKITTTSPGNEVKQLQHAIDVYGASRNRKGMSIELAIRDWARHDPEAASIVEQVDLYRLECTRRLFSAAGLSEADAKSRSLLLYACVFGLSLMFYNRFDDNIPGLKQNITDRILSP
ncbi:MAG TPA: TetR/AcrR family transcriptional regulator [Rhodocyclaceae bacterium]|nr:TetR/AcrR family transcriptional regulator [Rhodocyclaceae bacterium]